jgi:hypothetical protein
MCLLTVAIIILVSWGSVGHHAVGAIAQNHLTPQAKAAVEEILGNETLADVSTWADEVRNTTEYKQTTPWHYINAPLGLNYEEFSKTIKSQSVGNIYSAILNCEHQLADKAASREQKIEALKFLVHFVGDAHQPMHVSRAEDKGGNTVQVQFDGRGTNLHSVWDSKLIDHSGLTYVQMAKEFDTASQEEIKKWQSDDVMRWLYESYQISTRLYGEVENNNKLDEAYYKEHLPIVEQRIEMAGIRLAGVLNHVLSGVTISNNNVSAPLTTMATKGIISDVPLEGIHSSLGNMVRTKGKVYGVKDIGSMVLVDLGAAYPNQLLNVVLKGKAMDLKDSINGKIITVNGTVIDYKGKPEIVVTDPQQLEY